MLKLEHVSKTFNLGTVNEKKALQDLNLTVNDGDFITIIGGNGAGKKYLTLNMIAGVYPIDCGYILLTIKTSRSPMNINVPNLLDVFSKIL